MQAALKVKYRADLDPVSDEFGARGIDVIDHEQQTLRAAWCCRRESLAEEERTRGTGGRYLHYPPAVTTREIRVQPPTHAQVETLGAIDVGHGKDDDLKSHVDATGSRRSDCAFIARHCAAHRGPLEDNGGRQPSCASRRLRSELDSGVPPHVANGAQIQALWLHVPDRDTAGTTVLLPCLNISTTAIRADARGPIDRT